MFLFFVSWTPWEFGIGGYSCLLSPRAFLYLVLMFAVRTGVLPCRHDPRPHDSIPSRVRSSHRFGAANQDLGDVVGCSYRASFPCAPSAGEVSIILMVANTLNDFSREQLHAAQSNAAFDWSRFHRIHW